MGQRRRGGSCPHADSLRPYPVWPEPDWPLGADAAIDAALARFSDELNRFAGELEAAVRELSIDELDKMLTASAVNDRARALRWLNLNVAPRHIGDQLRRDVLSRLKRADQHALRHAVPLLSLCVVRDIFKAVHATSGPNDEDRPQDSADLEERWSPSLLRAAFWGHVLATVQDARVCAWACEQRWTDPATASSDAVASLAHAAARVIELTPDFGRTAADRSDEAVVDHAHDDDEEVHPVVRTETTDIDGAGSTAMQQPPDADAARAEGRAQPMVRLSSAYDVLEAAFSAALPAAHRIVEAVGSERLPESADLEVLAGLRSSFDTVVGVLGDFGIEADGDDLASIARQVSSARASTQDAELRASLAEILALRTASQADGLDVPLSLAQQHAGRLLSAGPWDSAQRGNAEAFAALAKLTDVSLLPAERIELTQRVVTVLPELATLAVLAEKLRPANTALVEPSQSPAAPAVPEPSVTAPAEPVESPRQNQESSPSEAEPEGLAAVGPDDEADDVHRSVKALTVRLIVEGRFGMAAELTDALGEPRVRRDVLRTAALAEVVLSENGGCNSALRALLESLDADEIASDTPALLLAVPALIRAAVVTGESVSGALLNSLAGRLEPNLAEIAQNVGRRALHGVFTGSIALTVAADVSGSERDFLQLGDAAREVMRHRNLIYNRATAICKKWLAADGLLGRPLGIVASNDQDSLDVVREAIARLRDESQVARELDSIDTRLRGSSGKRLEGAARRSVIELVAEAVAALAAWADAVAARGHGRRRDQWSIDEVSSMLNTVLGMREPALAALAVHIASGDETIAASAQAAQRSLETTFAVLAGKERLGHTEPSPQSLLTAELLKVPGASVDPLTGRATVPNPIAITALADAAESDWRSAIGAQAAAENFVAANALLDAAMAGIIGESKPELEDARVIRRRLADQEAERRAQLRVEGAELAAALRRARLNNQTADEQDDELNRLLDDALQESRNLTAARDDLARVKRLLAEYQRDSASRLRDRLDSLPKATAETRNRIAGYVDSGQLSVAEELIYFAEIGESVPDHGSSQRNDLADCFPAVPVALTKGLTPELIHRVRRGEAMADCPVLDFSHFSQDRAAAVHRALDNWRSLRTRPAEDRARINERDLLLPALRLAGIDARTCGRLDEMTKGRGTERRFIELREVTVQGRPLVPEFGSKLGGRLRVMLAWGQPSAEKLMSDAAEDKTGDSLLIAYFGTMTERMRGDLAVRAVASRAPVIVLDDAVLAYLAARGEDQIDTAMALMLPFSSVNPYVREKRGLVAEEMFYGRDDERRALVDPNGTQIIFGGRGLGKSALLRRTATEFENQMPDHRAALYLSVDTEGIAMGGMLGPDAIWVALRQRLAGHELMDPGRAKRTGHDAHEQVRETLLGWLAGDSRRRMLILLDECDRFFESDAPSGFVQTRRLKDLGQQSDGRVKVVFAGLHSVQRFAKAAPNGPFSHLAQRPTVIGPLRPQFASDLLTTPLRALGFVFEDEDVVNRILGYCSYQPFLLQMFANRLVDAMHRKRVATAASPKMPPFVITRDDIEAVEEQADLRADIRAAFHDTLHLDPRYNVIANALAHYALETGLDSRMSEAELLGECRDWWLEGFARLDVEAFRAYLHEMVGLGILAANNDRRGWHLRSPNVLMMIGTRDEIEAQLVGPHPVVVPEEFAALEERLARPDGRRSPLTASQLIDITGDHVNQVRVILGSQATGVLDVVDAVQEVTTLGDVCDVVPVTDKRRFLDGLVTGVPGTHRIVLDDLTRSAPRDDACLEALDNALSRWPKEPGVTRSAVLIAGPAQLTLWRALLDPDAGNARSEAGIVVLRRYNSSTLALWALQGNSFNQDVRRDELLRVTGGWPILVEKAASMSRSALSESATLRRLQSQLFEPEGVRDLIDQVGLTAHEDLSEAFDAILALSEGEPMSSADVHAAVETQVVDAATVVACLMALQVFDVDGKGMLTPEPLLARCWPLYER